MKAKEFLSMIRHKDTVIGNLISEKEYLEDAMCGVKGLRYDLDKIQSSPDPDRMAGMLARIEEKEKEIRRRIDDLIDFRSKCVEMINGLQDDGLIAVLYKRYIEFRSWEQIAEDLGYSVRHVLRLHGEALIAFSTKYAEELERCH